MNSTVLITGCSSGFGRATAALFLARGWNVIATMRTPDPTLFEGNDRLLVTALDVTDPSSVSDAIAEGVARFGRLDVLVNNAGVGLLSAFEATPDDVLRQVFETNTFGVMAMTRAVAPHMRERGSGTIVNVTSSVCIAPMPLLAIYTASKYAVEGFSESLAYELGMFGVRVKIVEPGLAPSTSFADNAGGRMDGLIPAAYSAYAARLLESMREYPMPYTTEADVAEAVYAAATDDGDRLRYTAGADSAMLAGLRQTLDEQAFMARVRTMAGDGPVEVAA